MINESSGQSQTKQLPIKAISDQSAREHADLVSIYQDLQYVLWATDKAHRLLTEGAHDGQQLQTFWSASLIAYRRCFNSGKRYGLSVGIYENLPGEPSEAHQYYIDQASKLIAHSVNPFEAVRVGVVLDDDKIIGVAELSARLTSTSDDGYKTLRGLTLHATRYLEERIKASRERVQDVASKMNPEDLNMLETIQYTVPGPDDAGSARS